MPAPNIPYQQLPIGQQMAPQSIFQDRLNQQKDYLQQQYDAQWKLLRKTSRNEKEFRSGVDQLIAKTDANMNKIQFEHQQQTGILNQIGKLTKQGMLSPEAGQRAMWQSAGFNIPKQGQRDWRLEHGRVITELKRLDKILGATDASDKPIFPKHDVKWGFGKQMEYDYERMSSERKEYLRSALNAREILLQQEKEIFQGLPRPEQKATELQSAYTQREKIEQPGFAYGFGTFGVTPKRKTKEPQTFAGGIRADMPTKPKLKRLTSEIAKRYIYKYNNRQEAMAAARRDGYTE